MRRDAMSGYYTESTDKSCRKCGKNDQRPDRTKAWSGWTYVESGPYKKWLCPECQNAEPYKNRQGFKV